MNEQFFTSLNGYKVKDEEARKSMDKNTIDLLNLNPLVSLKYSNNDTMYEGNPHSALQGFCVVGNNIVFALRGGTSNYVNLVEINKETGQLIRENYLLVNHANSISYNVKDNKLYIASCNKYENNSIVADNQIFVVDYDNFSILNTLNISNLESDQRIRSVYYDNDNNILYAGNSFELFVIDEVNELITDTINLDTTNIDTSVTNQTLKRYKDMFVGIYLSYLAFWDLEGNLLKIIGIPQINRYDYIGEIEDFDIKNNNIIIGCCSIISDERNDYKVEFLSSNIKTNTANELIKNSYIGSGVLNVYVNNKSTSIKELGTQSNPYKDLQNAINMCKNTSQQVRITINGDEYDNIVINGISNLRLNFVSDIIVDGMDINQSNVRIENSNNLQINGINMNLSKLSWIGSSNFNNKIEPKENSTLAYNNKNIQIYNGELILHNISLDLKNKTGNPVITHRSKSIFTECDFSNYDNDYAIYLNNSSECYINQCTFNKEVSSTEHNIAITKGSTLFRNSINDDYNNYVLANGGNLLPSTVIGYNGSNLWYGDVCNIPSGYTHAIIKLKISGNDTQFMYRIIDLSQSEIILDTSYTGQYGIRIGYMKCSLSNNKLSITENKTGYIKNNSVFSYATNTDVTPSEASDKQSFIAIKNVKFVRL